MEAQLSSFFMQPTLFFLAAKKSGMLLVLGQERKNNRDIYNTYEYTVYLGFYLHQYSAMTWWVKAPDSCILLLHQLNLTVWCGAEMSHPTSRSILSCSEGETSVGSTNGWARSEQIWPALETWRPDGDWKGINKIKRRERLKLKDREIQALDSNQKIPFPSIL